MGENAIVLANEWQALQEQARVFVKSGLLPKAVDTPEKAIVIMLQGRELGIGYMQALNGINVIQGKPTVSPQLMLALIENSGKQEDIQIVGDAKSCTVTMKRVGRTAHSETFTIDNANAMGLKERDNWKKQPAVMLKWRAVSACARVVYPDVIAGMYTTEELNPDVTVDVETGEIRDVTPSPTIQEMADSGLVTVDDVERIDAGGPVDEHHWIKDNKTRSKFWRYVKEDLQLTKEEVHEALEVAHVEEYTHGKDAAFAALKEYAADKAEALQDQDEAEISQSTLDAYFDTSDNGAEAIAAIRGA